MIVLLLFVIPLLSGVLSFFLKNEKAVRIWALVSAILTLFLALAGTMSTSAAQLNFHADWMGSLGSSFSLKLDGLSKILCLLTAVAYPIIFLATWRSDYHKPGNFFALMLLTQAGIIGVFLASDALLFYFFWELALIPMYFLCSGWGGERRIPVTFKFFVYTFTSSVLMLVGLIYLYYQTPDRSFALESFYNIKLAGDTQSWVFWLLFVAFAVKIPVFPFHTWQPDTYETSPNAATMVLSGIMVKMGLYGVIRWVLPVVPIAAYSWGDVAMSLGVIGIIYASILAMQQDDFKRMIAYSSIAHVGIMITALFAEDKIGYQGVMIQMFNHGVNIIGLWIVVELIERQFGTRKLSQLGGIAQKAPALAILLFIMALANLSLPLTNSFIGEFMMFNGIWNSNVTSYNIAFAAIAAVSIILVAAYTLNMVQKIFYGNTSLQTANTHDIRSNEKMALVIIALIIIVFGIYPQPLLNITDGFVDGLLTKINVAHMFGK
jgi:NADH-quinone oxidoreductase subunit M